MILNRKIFNKLNSSKWLHFMTEVVLIVLAINIGLWFNNMNDQWNEKQLETRILNELLISLKSDVADINSNILTHKKGIQAAQNLLNQESAENAELDISSEFSLVYSWSFLLADLSTYESLKSIGFLLISDDDLRRKVTKLYNVDYKNVSEQEDNHKRMCHNFDIILQNQYVTNNQANLSADDELVSAKSPSTTITAQQAYIVRQLAQSHDNMKTLYEAEILVNLNDLIESIDLVLLKRR